MEDRELSAINLSGELSGIQLSGITPEKKVLPQEDIDSKLAPILSRLDNLESYFELILLGVSIATDQQPSAVDTPLQIEYGVEQITDDVTLNANGAMTFHSAGIYQLLINGQYGRLGASGTSTLGFRVLKDTVQQGGSSSSKLDDENVLLDFVKVLIIEIGIGDVITTELIRSSAGSNSGGLFATSFPSIGWNDAASASVQIRKLIGL